MPTKITESTLLNAMYVSESNNLPRIEELFYRKNWSLTKLAYVTVSDKIIKLTIKELPQIGCSSELYATIAYSSLHDQLKKT
ncbi:hypothetical protein [Pantoea sp. Mhis]|uniref:hypothetical protein n=1 Tax=Pantoea sp. Mhis TaxID=2576759 RepID=UPI00135B1E50|nr:hypothetical protein [Pantoea sp. Mhis]MXP56464.1 hypothetical protein [Pantoea sp. Mhis]